MFKKKEEEEEDLCDCVFGGEVEVVLQTQSSRRKRGYELRGRPKKQ